VLLVLHLALALALVQVLVLEQVLQLQRLPVLLGVLPQPKTTGSSF
jgi:hypothetical protein